MTKHKVLTHLKTILLLGSPFVLAVYTQPHTSILEQPAAYLTNVGIIYFLLTAIVAMRMVLLELYTAVYNYFGREH